MGRKVNGLERCGVAGPWTRRVVRVCRSRLARSSRWFCAGGGGLVGEALQEGTLRGEKGFEAPLRCLRSLRSSLKVPSKASAKASTLEATSRYLKEAWRL